MYDIEFLKRLSQTLLQSANGDERKLAEETLSGLIDCQEGLQYCVLLLQEEKEPYCPAVAVSMLKRLLNRKIGISLEQRLQLSQFLLQYLFKGTEVQTFVQNLLCKHFAMLTKIGWLEQDQSDKFPFQTPIKEIQSLCKEPTHRGILALKLLTSLIEEMDSSEGLESMAKQRKIAADFRDSCLTSFFTLSIEMLKSVLDQPPNSLNETTLHWTSHLLGLTLSCLSFDFIGSLYDESSDENINVQIPTKWRPILLENQVVTMLFNFYQIIPSTMVAKAFQSLVQLASVRRLLFDPTDRQKYIEHFIIGLKLILDNPEKLNVPDNFHHFWRIISRLKANYQIAELNKSENFLDLLRLLTQFTLESLKAAHLFTNNSIYYLISFWSRIAGSLSYTRSYVDTIAACIPSVSSAYIQSRLTLSEAVVREGVDDPLDDMGSVKQTMDLFTIICRIDYKKTAEELVEHFNENVNALFGPMSDPQNLLIPRKRLVWLVTLMAAGVNGKASIHNSESDDDIYDAELVTRVFNLITMTDARPELVDPSLEMAYIYFMEEFRKAYLTDYAPRERDTQLFDKLKESLGISDDASALEFYSQKILTNLKFWGKSEKLLTATLTMLNNLTIGYTNARRLLIADGIQFLLKSHNQFEFISSNDLGIMRSRTSFYEVLMRILNIEIEDNPAYFFDFFMKPIIEKFEDIKNVFAQSAITPDNQLYVRLAVIGICRDLRGIASACTKKANYTLLLNWAIEHLFTALMESIKLWIDVADLTTPILKLLAELMMNRQSRLTYDMHSCTSVLLFRKISTLIVEYGDRFLQLPTVADPNNYYKERLKNIGVICNIIRNVLSGAYLPYGIFWLYDDPCLSNALTTTFKLLLFLQQEKFEVYTKLAQAAFYFLEIVVRTNMPFVTKLEEHTFVAILNVVNRGISSLDSPSASTCCTVLDLILDYIFEKLYPSSNSLKTTKEPEGNAWQLALEKNPDILLNLLGTLLNQILFEDVKCLWAMSRPLLCLIILNNKVGKYESYKIGLIRHQPHQLQHPFEQALGKLMNDIKENLGSKNKDCFTQNVNVLRKEVDKLFRGEPVNVASDNSEDQSQGGDFIDNPFMTD